MIARFDDKTRPKYEPRQKRGFLLTSSRNHPPAPRPNQVNPKRILIPLIATFVALSTTDCLNAAPRDDSSAALPGKYAKNYLIAENTISPNKKFAIIFPTLDASESKAAGDYLVCLKPFRILAKLDTKWPHFQNKSHGGISAEWSGDSGVALVTLDSKWGPGDIFLFALEDGKVKRTTNLLAKIYDLLLPDYRRAKAARYNDYFDFIFESNDKPICKLDGTKQVRIDAKATTDPKGLDKAHSWHGRVRALWNIPQAKFTSQK